MDLAANQEAVRQGHGASLVSGSWLTRPLSELGLTPVTSIASQAKRLQVRKQGRIVIDAGSLESIYGRWWPYQGTVVTTWTDKKFRNYPSDRCELFYHAPFRSNAFLTLSYVRSGPKTSLSSLFAATLVLDEIARLKQTNAMVCQVSNSRISDRLMKRWGWEEHCQHLGGRNFIKRFYDGYPTIPSIWRERLGMPKIHEAPQD